ncbi:MAG: cation-transporting P-type ATPase [Chloroflexales bacterium]
MTPTDRATAYQHPADAVLAALGSDAAQGLVAEEVCRRLAQYGPNELQAEAPTPAWRKLLAQFQDVLIGLLVASSVVWLRELSKAALRLGRAVGAGGAKGGNVETA